MDALTSPTAPQSTTPVTDSSQPRATLNSDYETFLRMLTVQMKNQDPLNPVDSAEFSLQLATFSALEQQVLTNDLLKGLVADMGTNSLQGMADLLGKEVLSARPAQFDGTGMAVMPRFAEGADSATLVVYDASGAVVERTKIDLGTETLDWSGTAPDGNALPEGVYDFQVESYAGTEFLSAQSALTYSTVSEARRGEDGGVVLLLDSGHTVVSDEVEAVRTAR